MSPANIPKTMTMLIESGQKEIVQIFIENVNLPVDGAAYLAVSLNSSKNLLDCYPRWTTHYCRFAAQERRPIFEPSKLSLPKPARSSFSEQLQKDTLHNLSCSKR
jgi:hypothetical protein